MKTIIMLIAAVALSGCATTQSNVVCDGTSKSMTCHNRSTVECPHGFTDQEREKVPTQYHRPISFKE